MITYYKKETKTLQPSKIAYISVYEYFKTIFIGHLEEVKIG